MHTGISVHTIPVCLWGFAHPRMHTGIDLDPGMHTGITCHVIPVCIRRVSCDPRMHTGICLIPVCIRGLLLIPVCIRGLHVNNPRMHMGIFMRSPYAYGDQANPHMHTGISIELRVPQARADEGARVRAWCTAAQHIRGR
jgi:hypothetical protein